MQQVEIIDPGFSTADANYPGFESSSGNLKVTFLDWQEQTINVTFKEVMAFKWQEAEQLLPNEPYDGACKILNSEWLTQHGNIADYNHYCFNFNACGKLEVLCSSFAVSHN